MMKLKKHELLKKKKNSSESPNLRLIFQIHNPLNHIHELNQKAQFNVEE